METNPKGHHYSRKNGVQSQGRRDYDGETDGGEVIHCDEQEVSHGRYGGHGKGQGEVFSHEDDAADSSSVVKEIRSAKDGSFNDQDSIAQSIFTLQSAQEALEQELLKFKEISKDITDEESVSESDIRNIDKEEDFQKITPEQIPPGIRTTINSDLEAEVEELFKQKIEAEVENLAISDTIKKMRVAAMDQTTLSEEQKALATEQIHILDKLEGAENKAMTLKEKAKKLENICEDISNADEALRLQKKFNKYCAYFFLQVLLMVVIVGVFISGISSNRENFVPT